MLYEAATVLLTRSRSECDLRKWGLQLRERLGFKRATVAVARKLAVIMHSMLITGEPFGKKSAAACPALGFGLDFGFDEGVRSWLARGGIVNASVISGGSAQATRGDEGEPCRVMARWCRSGWCHAAVRGADASFRRFR